MGGLRSFGAELVGTFALTLAAAGAACLDAATGGRIGPLGVALAYGGATTAMLYSLPIAHGRFNPALTLANAALKRADLLRSVFAVTAQLLGAACAGLFLRAVLEGGRPELLGAPSYLGTCAPVGIGYRAATLVEAVMTFFLGTALIASESRKRRTFGPLAVGAATALGVLVAGPLTGGAMNPARAFGPALAAGRWTHHYVYWVGPLAGAALAAWIAPYLVTEETLP